MRHFLLIGGAALAVVLAAWVAWNCRVSLLVRDTQSFMASEAAVFTATHPSATQAELYAAVSDRLRELRDASVTDARFDASGTLVDPWSSVFLLQVEAKEGAMIVTCTSIGPDRRAGTWDDIVRVYSGIEEPPANPALQPTPQSRRG